MLEYPPREGFFRRKLGNVERNARLAVRGEAYFVRTLVIDANAHHIKVHYSAQLAGEKPEQLLRRSD